MSSAVALLRGINVGGHRKVPMAELRALADELGLANPQTYVASGNLLFDSALSAAELKTLLEQAIEQRFGFAVDVVVRTAGQWREYVRSNPFAEEAAAEPKWVWMFLSNQPPLEDAAARMRAAPPNVNVSQAGDALWIHMPGGATRKILSIPWDRLIGSPATSRNWRTVQTIGNLLEQRPLRTET